MGINQGRRKFFMMGELSKNDKKTQKKTKTMTKTP